MDYLKGIINNFSHKKFIKTGETVLLKEIFSELAELNPNFQWGHELMFKQQILNDFRKVYEPEQPLNTELDYQAALKTLFGAYMDYCAKHSYALFAEDYKKFRREKPNPSTHLEIPAMIEIAGNVEGKKVLDLCCGFGDQTLEYAKRGASVIGVDKCGELLEITEPTGSCTYFKHDVEKKLPFKNKTFDLVTCSFALSHIKNLDNVFTEVHRVLKKNGEMIFSIAHPFIFQEEKLAGKNGRRIFGDYFRKRKIRDIWEIDSAELKWIVEYYHRPLETYFRAFLNLGFELLDYREPTPVRTLKELSPLRYEFWSRVPYIAFFKIKKSKAVGKNEKVESEEGFVTEYHVSSELKEIVERIIKNYKTAWEKKDLSALRNVFARTAKYHEKPGSSMENFEEIAGYWRNSVIKNQSGISFKALRVSGKQDLILIDWECDFFKESDSEKITIKGIMILNIDDRIVNELKECWYKTTS